MRWPWSKPDRLDPQLAKALLEELRVEIFPGVLSNQTNRFEQERCDHCRGLHSRKCPAIAEVGYHENGKVSSVKYWPEGQWDESRVLWLEDIVEAAQEEAYGESE